MPDVLTKEQRSYNMSRIRSKNTAPELVLRSALNKAGMFGFRSGAKITGKPDLIFSQEKVAVFVDGCFWHKCPKCYREPKTNKLFWEKKIRVNIERDKKVNAILRDSGWIVLRFWEHDIKKNVSKCVLKIKSELSKFNVIDLFCGAGGLSYGFEKSGFRILLGIDINKSAIETFDKNHNNSKSLCEDMRNISVSKIKAICNNRKIHVIVGGPPCQGFSMAGKRQPNDPRNSLFREYIRIVKGINPEICVMENVRGLLSMKTPEDENVIEVITKEFKKLNYDIEVNKINTADYGIPQKRHRIFIIAHKKNIKFIFPETIFSKDGTKKWKSIKNILLPKSKIDKSYFYSKKLIRGFIRRAKNNKKNGLGFGWKFLDKDKPSFTISARYYKDGAEALIKYSESEIRMLTPEECALIQTFSKSFRFSGSKNSIYQQVGNAVPPLMAKIIAKNINMSLEAKYHGRKY